MVKLDDRDRKQLMYFNSFISAAKYHTSKLREFTDVEGIATFGFRGEALSSLCALSDMTIITKHHSVDVATRMEYNKRGEITKRMACARQTGTTVILTDLFGSLPVRKREFQKNIQKEYNKMCEIVQAYGLIAYGKRIFLTNQTSRGGKTTVFSTNGSFSMYDNIMAIFGSKQSTNLLEINQPVRSDEVLTQDVLRTLDASISLSDAEVENLGLNRFVFDGYVSNCTHGYGRSTRDRQFFFINGRPCEPKSLIKIVNDAYHKFNVNQYPFIALNIMLDRKEVDVNLTPDKRSLLVNNEAILKLALKKSLLSTFTPLATTFKLQNTSILSYTRPANSQRHLCDDSGASTQYSSSNIDSDGNKNDTNNGDIATRKPLLSSLTRAMNAKECLIGVTAAKRKSQQLDDIATRSAKLKKIQDYLQTGGHTDEKAAAAAYNSDTDNDSPMPTNDQKGLGSHKSDPRPATENDATNPTNSRKPHPLQGFRIDCKVADQSARSLKIEHDSPAQNLAAKGLSKAPLESRSIQSKEGGVASKQLTLPRNCANVSISLSHIEKLMMDEIKLESQSDNVLKGIKMKFKAKIEPSKNKAAEAELETEILQEDFQRMAIIGQFNLGFIICRLDNDLFIVDQHATDEKYNFETLQKTTRLQHQPLVIPQSLGLSAISENILLNHMEMFEMNGFRFSVNMEQPVTERIKLTAKPYSKNWDFGRDVINELIFMIQEDSEDSMSIDVCRPSKIRAMFASRACRKSVMIGTSLSKSDMRRLIDHMGLIEHPWVN